MAAPPPGQGTVCSAEGVVAGAPRRWLGLEGLVLLAGAVIAFAALGQPWWLVPAAILAPDIAMIGYLAGTRPGAHLYNLTHATLLPTVMGLPRLWLTHRVGWLGRACGLGVEHLVFDGG